MSAPVLASIDSSGLFWYKSIKSLNKMTKPSKNSRFTVSQTGAVCFVRTVVVVLIQEKGRSVMNRDEEIYNLSHVYDPVIQEKVDIKKASGTGNGENFSRHSSAGSSQQQAWRSRLLQSACETVDKNVSIYLVLSSNLNILALYAYDKQMKIIHLFWKSEGYNVI